MRRRCGLVAAVAIAGVIAVLNCPPSRIFADEPASGRGLILQMEASKYTFADETWEFTSADVELKPSGATYDGELPIKCWYERWQGKGGIKGAWHVTVTPGNPMTVLLTKQPYTAWWQSKIDGARSTWKPDPQRPGFELSTGHGVNVGQPVEGGVGCLDAQVEF